MYSIYIARNAVKTWSETYAAGHWLITQKVEGFKSRSPHKKGQPFFPFFFACVPQNHDMGVRLVCLLQLKSDFLHGRWLCLIWNMASRQRLRRCPPLGQPSGTCWAASAMRTSSMVCLRAALTSSTPPTRQLSLRLITSYYRPTHTLDIADDTIQSCMLLLL